MSTFCCSRWKFCSENVEPSHLVRGKCVSFRRTCKQTGESEGGGWFCVRGHSPRNRLAVSPRAPRQSCAVSRRPWETMSQTSCTVGLEGVLTCGKCGSRLWHSTSCGFPCRPLHKDRACQTAAAIIRLLLAFPTVTNIPVFHNGGFPSLDVLLRGRAPDLTELPGAGGPHGCRHALLVHDIRVQFFFHEHDAGVALALIRGFVGRETPEKAYQATQSAGLHRGGACECDFGDAPEVDLNAPILFACLVDKKDASLQIDRGSRSTMRLCTFPLLPFLSCCLPLARELPAPARAQQQDLSYCNQANAACLFHWRLW